MKQEITDKQWNELTKRQKTIFCDFIQETLERVKVYNPNIGHMIAFLGNDWWREIFFWDYGEIDCRFEMEEKEFCDFLWEKVKQKLI